MFVPGGDGAALVVTANLLAATDSSASSTIGDLAPFLNVGFLGLIFVLLVNKKFIVPKYYADDQISQRDKIIEQKDAEIAEWKAQVHDLQKVATEQLLPVVVESVAAQKEYTNVLRESLNESRNRQRRYSDRDDDAPPSPR